MIFVIIFAVALILSAVLTRLVRDVANLRGWASGPVSKRHLHEKPVPRLGGIGILTAIVIVVAGEVAAANFLHIGLGVSADSLLGLLGPTLLIFGLGVSDDSRTLSPYFKFGVQIVAAAWLFANGCRVTSFHLLFGDKQVGNVEAFVLTVFWVLLITNAFNLLDGLDGLAAGSALFSSLVVFVVSLVTGDGLSQMLTIALAGAIVGFLRYNFNPATIFLGDCGSLVIGFLLSAISLESSQKASTTVAVAIPVVSFGLPILDTFMAVMRRFLNGRPLFRADDEHIHHKLLQRGLTHKQAVVVLYAVSACFALVSLPLLSQRSGNVAVVLSIVGLGVFFGLQHLGYREVDELRRFARRTLEQKSIIYNNLAIRRAEDELAHAKTSHDIYRILRAAFEENDYDGFELSFTPHVRTAYATAAMTLPMEYSWRREESNGIRGWELRFDLTSENSEVRGYLNIRRSYTRRFMRSDIDCFSEEFMGALTAALRRAAENRGLNAGILSTPVNRAAGIAGVA